MVLIIAVFMIRKRPEEVRSSMAPPSRQGT
jgi:hypothetical protein